MRRHDIKIRRESLGQTRIEKHKDFGGLMKVHERRQMRKLLVRNMLTLMAVLFLIALVIYGSIKLKSAREEPVEDKPQVFIEQTIDYPDGILR